MAQGKPTYDRIGTGYAATRKPDPRVAQRIWTALGDARRVLNVGAGTGSYEPPQCQVVAVEPSVVMAAQRQPDAAPCVIASAEALPFLEQTFDAVLCVLTVHHWSDLAAGFAELRRVARHRIVILTWEQEIAERFWLVERYLPEVRVLDAARAVSLARFAELLPGAHFETVPVPHDCQDGFFGAFWQRPAAYLEPQVRAGMSCLRQIVPNALERGLAQLRAELEDGTWQRLFGQLRERAELDLGYRLVVWERS